QPAMSTPDRTGVKETCRILNSSNPAHFPPPNLPNHVMPGPDRVSSQHDLTGSCETYHEHQCPTSQPARVETYHQCVLYIHTAHCYINMPLRYCGDAACCISRQRPCNWTTTMSHTITSSFEGGQPCDRVQRSKAGACQPREGVPDALSKPKPSPSTS